MGQETPKSVKQTTSTAGLPLDQKTGAQDEGSVPPTKPVLITIEGTPSNQLQTGTCYAHALAPAIYMALKTRSFDNLNPQTGPLPTIDEIRDRIIRLFPQTTGGNTGNSTEKSQSCTLPSGGKKYPKACRTRS
ncbi:hypothetical protein V8F33_011930 [Rhypophila sp. PSN 637]